MENNKTDSLTKNFSTEDSRNSLKKAKEPTQDNIENLRLFTFMNYKQSPKTHKVRKLNISDLGGERLMEMIQHSRRRRQSYLNQVQKSNLNNMVEQNVKKPKTARLSVQNKVKNIKKNQNEKSAIRLTLPFSSKSPRCITPQSSSNKMFRAKSSLGSLKVKEPIINENQQLQLQKLIKKKHELEKELMNINSSLLMKKRKNNMKPTKKKNN